LRLSDGGWSVADLDPANRRHRPHCHAQAARGSPEALTARCSAIATRATTGIELADVTSTATCSHRARTGRFSITTSPASPTPPKRRVTAAFAPRHAGIAENRIGIATLPEAAHQKLGAPHACEFALSAVTDRQVEITLTLRDKPANRMPEAGFLGFTPDGPKNWALRKMGLWHDGAAITRQGGGQLQAVEAVRSAALTLELLDAALVSPAGAPFLPFQPEKPDFSAGLRVNLYNNKWGTNFPMWWEGSIAFRFRLTLA
jgi:hypothetical protein